MNIVIAGGGTAGWLASFFLIKNFKHIHNITLIESSKIGIIGAGEGSTGIFLDLLENRIFDADLDINEFLVECDATPKLGINHINWSGDGRSYFAPLDGSPLSHNSPDFMLMQAKLNYGKEGMHRASRLGILHSQNRVNGGSVHFDAHKVGKFFKKKSVAEGVEYIDNEILAVKTDSQGQRVISLTCVDGTVIEGDFFIDCTGFKRCLMGAMDVKWKSYKDNLPVDCAMPFIIPYKDDEIVKPETGAHAHSAGWMWRIPTLSRYGCGYVFSKQFIDPTRACDEIEASLGHEIEPIRVLDFESGRSENLWKGNCLALGLAAAFAEPLEATSIHTTVVQLIHLTFEHLKETLELTTDSKNIEFYNKKMSKMYDDFRDFLVLHYMGGRDDSEFWRYIKSGVTQTDRVKEILELSKTQLSSPLTFDYYYGCAGASLWNWILCGLELINDTTLQNNINRYNKSPQNLLRYYNDLWLREAESYPENTQLLRNIRTAQGKG